MQIFLNVVKNEIFVQSLGFLGLIITVFSIQNKKYNRMIFFRIMASLVFGFQYLLLGGYTGMATNLVSCGTNGVYAYRINRKKTTLPFQIAFCFLFIGIGILTWGGPASLLAMTAKVMTTVCYGVKNTGVIRKVNLITYPLWLVYDIIYFSIGGIINDIILAVAAIIAIARFDIKKKGNIDTTEKS